MTEVPLMVTAPVVVRVVAVTAPSKPLSDRTGPEKVVLATIIPYMQVGAHQSACRQPGLSDVPEIPGMGPIYLKLDKRKRGRSPLFLFT